MAKIGVKYPCYKLVDDTTNGVIGKAMTINVNITTNDVKMYGDDTVAESDRSFSNGTVSLETTDFAQEHASILLGHIITDDEMTANVEDESPYVGFGFYGTKKVDGERKYRAIWLTKVQFAEPNDENATKGETIAFASTTIEGTVLTSDNGDWKKEKTFDTEAEAKAYLDAKLGTTGG